jgi:hypothetical protein
VLLLATGWLWRLARQRALRGFSFASATTLPFGVLALVALFTWVKMNVQWAWSACRLAPALGILRGFPLYSPPDHGPINGWLYGPVAALCWLPAALARTPRGALETAEIINLVLLVAPLFLACLLSAETGLEQRVLAIWCGVAAAGSLLFFYPTWYMTAVLSADTATAGLGVVACMLLCGPGPGRRRLSLAAALTAAAFWSKQISAPLGLVQILWLLMSGRGAVIPRYLGLLVIWTAGMGLLFVTLFGATDMYFNMWVVPASQHLVGGWPEAWKRMGAFILYALPVGAICLLAWVARNRASPLPDERRSAPILFLAAILLLPVGVLASLKIGADINSVHSYYFLIAAAAAGVTALAAKRPARYAPMVVVLAGATLAGAFCEARWRSSLGVSLGWDTNEAAFEFARTRPGEAYFPWDPLATLLAENRYYHFEYGVQDRLYAGLKPTPEQIEEGLPRRLRLIIYPIAGMKGLMVTLKGPYSGETLSGPWTIFRYEHAPAGRSPSD